MRVVGWIVGSWVTRRYQPVGIVVTVVGGYRAVIVDGWGCEGLSGAVGVFGGVGIEGDGDGAEATR